MNGWTDLPEHIRERFFKDRDIPVYLHAGEGHAAVSALVSLARELTAAGYTVCAPGSSALGRALALFPQARTSRHPTNAVTAVGRRASYLTATHGKLGRRPGPYGDTAFAADSPYEKLLALHAAVMTTADAFDSVFLHELETHRMVNRYYYPCVNDENALAAVSAPLLLSPKKEGFWPLPDIGRIRQLLADAGILSDVRLPDGTPAYLLDARDYIAKVDVAVETDPAAFLSPEAVEWMQTGRRVLFHATRDFVYEAELRARFLYLLPDRVADSHFHVSLHRTNAAVPDEYSWYASLSEVVGSRIAGGLMMDSPSLPVRDDFEGFNEEIIRRARRHGTGVGMMTPPDIGYDRARALIEKYPKDIKAIKPYFTYAPAGIPGIYCDLFDFAPEWMFRLANEKRIPVLVHLSHYDKQCAHPNNIAEIRTVCKRYPDMKLVLAHCAMGHNPDRLRQALPQLADLDNIYFDCSGSTEATSIFYCIRYFGVDHILYGGDYDHSENLGRIIGQGGNFFAIHPQLSHIDRLPGPYHYIALSNLYEGLLALFTAIDMLKLKPRDVEKIFYGNHRKIYG